MGWSVWLVTAYLGAAPAGVRASVERGDQALQQGQLEDADAAFREALKSSPKSAEALNGLGSVLFKRGQKAEAIVKFEEAIQADDQFKLAYFNLGYVARKVSDFTTAARAYERYTALDPLDPDGFFGLGEARRQLGQRNEAIAAYARYVEMEKRPSEQKWVAKAQGYLQTLRAGERLAAPPSAGPAVPEQPKEAVLARMADGDRAFEQNRVAEAAAAYRGVLTVDASNAEAHLKLGNSLARLNDEAGAMAEWRKAAGLPGTEATRHEAGENLRHAEARSQPAAPPARATSAPLYEAGVRAVAARKYGEALESLTRAVSAEPGLAVAFVARGSAFMGLKRYPDALLDYQHALKLDPSKASALYGAAEVCRLIGKLQEAKGYYVRYATSQAPDVRANLREDARKKAADLP